MLLSGWQPGRVQLGRREGRQLRYLCEAAGRAERVAATTDPATDRFPAWSPDGKRIAFERSNAKGPVGIYTISSLGGAERKLTDFPGASQMSWSADGKWLAASSNTPEFSVI